jgi:hypothetical protein
MFTVTNHTKLNITFSGPSDDLNKCYVWAYTAVRRLPNPLLQSIRSWASSSNKFCQFLMLCHCNMLSLSKIVLHFTNFTLTILEY